MLQLSVRVSHGAWYITCVLVSASFVVQILFNMTDVLHELYNRCTLHNKI